ncbi:hypothetical protein JCM8097_004555 [Rhodosporidiobolus ruineniae]
MSSAPSAANPGFKVMSFSEFNDAQTQLMERITGPPAAQLIPSSFILSAVAAASEDKPLKVLDVCSGAGTVPDRLYKALGEDEGKVKVVSTDIEEKMVELAKQRAEVQGWTGFEAQVADGQALPFKEASFDFVFCCFGPQFFQEVPKGVAEAARVLLPGGRYSYTAWTSPGFVPFLLRAEPALTPLITPMFRKPCSVRSAIPSLLSTAGFDEATIKIEDVVVPYRFEGPEDFIEQMQRFPGPLMANEERCEKMKAVMREDFGEGAFTLEWVGVAVTVQKRA